MNKAELEQFLDYFPIVEPPVILSTEEAVIYSRENKPLSQKVIHEVILPIEKKEVIDEFAEYIPCFRLNKENGCMPVVYYRGDLLKNEFNLLIFSENGKMIDSKAIAGTFINGEEMITYIASIDEDHHINVVIGSNEGNAKNYNPLNSQAITYDIAPDGKILTNAE